MVWTTSNSVNADRGSIQVTWIRDNADQVVQTVQGLASFIGSLFCA